MKTIALLLFLGLSSLGFTAGRAQATTTVTTTETSSTGNTAANAVALAKDGVDASLRDHVVSVYGTGTPTAIQTWWVIFYDPAVASHGRSVKVENGQITRTFEAKGGVVYTDTLTYAPAAVSEVGPALSAAQTYAAQHSIAYDHTRVLLRYTVRSQAFQWRVQLLDGAASKGFVFVNTADGTFAQYASAGSVPAGTHTGGVSGDVEHAAHDVKNAFLGIGGDLQEFFTGERTVDQ